MSWWEKHGPAVVLSVPTALILGGMCLGSIVPVMVGLGILLVIMVWAISPE